ncbi:MAG TPA: HAD-IC family P-type ATPase, partial [Casimicrobium huifangae]|nr:HAD-IC family P-type ATPase [Casimicrobium huifangae]
AFDKTGTLTVGQPQLTATHAFDNWSEPQLLAAVAAVQRGSEHPLARAVVQAAAARSDVTVEAASDVRAIPGRGTEGHIADTALLIGSLRWMQELGADLSQAISLAESLQSAGATVSAAATRDPAGGSAPRIVGLLAFGDEPKPGATEALSRLRASGLRLCMISGDNRGAALAMAARLGLTADEVMAEVLPGDKAARVTALREGGHVVAMVGDGVNDAPALAAADVGIAMGTGTDVAMHAAAITLMRGDISLVSDALDISRRTVAKIRQNLFWAFAYNVAGIPLAAFGYLNPVVAGAAMAMSSVSVMTNALLLSRWKGR